MALCPRCHVNHPQQGLCRSIYVQTVGSFANGATAKQVAAALDVTAVRASNALGVLFNAGVLDRRRPAADTRGAAEYTYTIRTDSSSARPARPRHHPHPQVVRQRAPRSIAAMAREGWRGNKRTFWLKPDQTFALLAEAAKIDVEFGIFCTLLNYTGLRLSEGLGLQCEQIDLQREYAYVPDTKTGEPRAVYLPPVVVAALANHPRGWERRGRLFRFHNGGRLRDLLAIACERSGIELPTRTAFHVFRHNYATWMRLYGGLDAIGLTRTGAWADLDSVERYAHSDVTAEARQASLLPTPKRGTVVALKKDVG